MQRVMSQSLGLLCAAVLGACGQPASVETATGVVTGTTVLGVSRFLGVPFAAPPVGPLRFRPPAPHARWDQPLDATHVGPACPQKLGSTKALDEDCLRLNVWTPRLAGARQPVMVFIHGGSFVGGSGGDDLYDGTYLARKGGVVVVTINYRLGPLGFLAHPALAQEDANKSAGNYGLLDQQLALRWVQANIAAFGGDPGNVTIFGESAGAGSVCAQLASPLAAGLFHRAIGESGACLLSRTPLEDSAGQPYESAVSFGRHIAAAVGCDAAPDVAACLREKPVEQLLDAAPYQVSFDRYGAGYGPNIDGWVLPARPVDLVQGGRWSRVPYLSGVNKDEGTLFTISASVPARADFERLVRAALGSHADAALGLYPEARYPDPKAALTAFLGDFAFVCHQRLQARLVAALEPRTYLYQFTRANLTTALLGLGVTHALELPFVFHNFPQPFAGGPVDDLISDTMIGYWTRFAATGDPNGGGSVAWPAMTAQGDYLQLDVTPQAGRGLRAEICDVVEPWMLEP